MMTFAAWSLLIAGLMPYVVVAIAKAHGGYDNADPRNPSNFSRPLHRRAHAAHQNCLEAFGFFAVGVLLVGVRRAGAPHVDILAAIWLVMRLLYVWAYLADRASLRSLFWFAASFAAIGIYVSALLR